MTQEALDTALAVRDDEDAMLGEILLRQGAVSEDDLSSALQEQHGVEYRTVDWSAVDPQIAQLIPESLARGRLVLPIGLQDGALTLAMVGPDDLETISEVELLTGYPVVPVGTSSAQMLAALEQYFDENVTTRQTIIDMRIDEIRSGRSELTDEELNRSYDPNDAPIVRLVNSIISGGVRVRSSAIHLAPQGNSVRAR